MAPRPTLMTVIACALLSALPASAQVVSGTYLGNGAPGHAITGLGFKPALAIIKGDTAQPGVARSATMTGDMTKSLGGSLAVRAGQITSLDLGGFTVGADPSVNGAGISYSFVAFGGAPGTLRSGSYLGNGGAGQTISGVGFQPGWVIVLSEGPHHARVRTDTMDPGFSCTFDDDCTSPQIQTFLPDGFTVGSGLSVNASGTVNHWIAARSLPQVMATGRYSGNGTPGRLISGVGFLPEYAFIRSDGAAISAAHRIRSPGANASLVFDANPDQTNEIQSLNSDGFSLGSSPRVNGGSAQYFWVAFAQGDAGAGSGGAAGAQPGTDAGGAPEVGADGTSSTPVKVALVVGCGCTSGASSPLWLLALAVIFGSLLDPRLPRRAVRRHPHPRGGERGDAERARRRRMRGVRPAPSPSSRCATWEAPADSARGD